MKKQNNENELKFKVSRLPNKYQSVSKIIQIYFDMSKKKDLLQKFVPTSIISKAVEARVRIESSSVNSADGDYLYICTLKGPGSDNRIEENEIISFQLAYQLIKDAATGIIMKNRYKTKIGRHQIETDEYLNNELKGLFVSEVEYESGNAMQTDFTKKWISKKVKEIVDPAAVDVTSDKNYKNNALKCAVTQEEIDSIFNDLNPAKINKGR